MALIILALEDVSVTTLLGLTRPESRRNQDRFLAAD
jgi:hypothetical protein